MNSLNLYIKIMYYGIKNLAFEAIKRLGINPKKKS